MDFAKDANQKMAQTFANREKYKMDFASQPDGVGMSTMMVMSVLTQPLAKKVSKQMNCTCKLRSVLT